MVINIYLMTMNSNTMSFGLRICFLAGTLTDQILNNKSRVIINCLQIQNALVLIALLCSSMLDTVKLLTSIFQCNKELIVSASSICLNWRNTLHHISVFVGSVAFIWPILSLTRYPCVNICHPCPPAISFGWDRPHWEADPICAVNNRGGNGWLS